MNIKYYKYTLKGDHSEAEAQRALGDSAGQGTIVRIDTAGGQTQVYVASPEKSGAATKASAPKKAATALNREEITEGDITKFS
jgi:hypothetical protein